MNGIYARYKQEGEGKQGEQLFHVDMLDNNNTRKHFFQICDDIYNLAKGARPALYHQLIGCLRPRVMRRYCYNIDGIGTKDRKFLALNTTVPSTEPWPTTIAMHGLLTYVYCDKCGQVFEYSVEKYGPFVDEPTCPDCEEGTLLPRIELYGDTVGTWTFDTEEHKRIIRSDLQQHTDVLFAVGTTAAVLSMQQNLKLFASPARLRIWLNPKDPPPDGMKKLFVKICGTADNFAGLCMRHLKDAGRLDMVRHLFRAQDHH
jgi:NAD-dependent histone deacetylase SIR2